jgi:hypothetical protein
MTGYVGGFPQAKSMARARPEAGGSCGEAVLVVEVDTGSATSWGRPADRAWLVRLRRGERSVIVAWGLSHASAKRVAEQIIDVVCGGCG